MEWIGKRGPDWVHLRNWTIYDIYIEASELMGVNPKEF